MASETEVPVIEFPAARTCPFDPPTPYLDAMQEGSPRKVRIWSGQEPWLIARYDDIFQMLKDPRFSADVRLAEYPNANPAQPQVEGGQFHRSDGADHRRGRQAVNAEFTASRVEEWRPRIGELVEDCIDKMLEHGPPADLVEMFSTVVPTVVICEVLGVALEHIGTVHHGMEKVASLTASDEDKMAAIISIVRLLKKTAYAKVETPADDLMTRLVRERVDTGEMTMNEIAGLGTLIIGAGHHTTAGQLSLACVSLMELPEQRELLVEGGPEVAKTCSEEMLRYWTIVQTEPRRVALEDVELGGHTIRKGESVVCALGAANRDPSAFETDGYGPLDEINVLRPGRRHLAFGTGPHVCVGQSLTRVELQEALPRLFKRIPSLRLTVPADQLDYDEESLTMSIASVPVTWDTEE